MDTKEKLDPEHQEMVERYCQRAYLDTDGIPEERKEELERLLKPVNEYHYQAVCSKYGGFVMN